MNGPSGMDGEMDELERELAMALRRVDAPEGFAERTLARIEPPVRARVFTMPLPRVWASGALAATLLAGVVVAARMQERQRQAEIAAQQFDAAMRVTDRTLDHARAQLERAGVRLGDR